MKEEEPSKEKIRRKLVGLTGLLAAAGVVACVASFFATLGRFHGFFDLFSHFRVQYFLGLVVIGGALLLLRRRRMGAVLLVVAGLNLVSIAPLYWGGSNPGDGKRPSVRLLHANVNTQLGNPKALLALIEREDPDLIALAEVSSGWISELTSLESDYPYSVHEARSDNFGIALYSRIPLTRSHVALVGEGGVPSILATFAYEGKETDLVVTHPLPPTGREYARLRNKQLEALPDELRNGIPALVVGDLNVTPFSYHFRKLLQDGALRDSARGFGVQPTWPRQNIFLRIPIDHVLHTDEIAILSRRVGDDIESDHFPVIVDFARDLP